MNASVNRQILLVEKPSGKLGAEHFKLTNGAVPEPKDGEALLRQFRCAGQRCRPCANAGDPACAAAGKFVRQLAAARPARHGLGINPQHGCYFSRGEQAVFRLDLGSHVQRPLTRGGSGPVAESDQARP